MTGPARRALSLLALTLLTAAAVGAAPQVVQLSSGFCSPNVYGTGHVTIICKGVDPRAMERLNERLRATSLALEQKITDAEAWALRYRELETSLARATPGSSAAGRQEAIRDIEQAIKHDGTATVWDLGEIARAWQQVGDYRKATESAREAVHWAERHHGASSYEVARALEVLGHAQVGAGDFESAAQAYLAAHKICFDRYGRNDLRCARLRHNIALVHNKRKIYLAALDMLAELEDIYLSAYGENSRELGEIYHTAGVSLWGVGRYDEARVFFERALNIERKHYPPPTHPRVAVTLNALGDTHRDLGNYATAVAYHQQAIDAYVGAHGNTHHHVANAHASMARTLKAAGDYRQAVEHYQKALAIYKQTIGIDNPRTQLVARQLEAAEKLLAGRTEK